MKIYKNSALKPLIANHCYLRSANTLNNSVVDFLHILVKALNVIMLYGSVQWKISIIMIFWAPSFSNSEIKTRIGPQLCGLMWTKLVLVSYVFKSMISTIC